MQMAMNGRWEKGIPANEGEKTGVREESQERTKTNGLKSANSAPCNMCVCVCVTAAKAPDCLFVRAGTRVATCSS